MVLPSFPPFDTFFLHFLFLAFFLGIPKGIDFIDVRSTLLNIPGVVTVHNLRVWSLSLDKVAMSTHLAIGKRSWKGKNHLLMRPFHFIGSQFQISPFTLSFHFFFLFTLFLFISFHFFEFFPPHSILIRSHNFPFFVSPEKGTDPAEVLKIASSSIRSKFDVFELTIQVEEYRNEMEDCTQCQNPE